jgi:hypothetical protein
VKRFGKVMKMVVFDPHDGRTPNSFAIKSTNAIPTNAARMIHTGCGIGIPLHFTRAMIAQQTMAAMANQTRSPISDPVDGMEATKTEKESAFMDLEGMEAAAWVEASAMELE